MSLNLIITGYKDHGKGTTCKLLEPQLTSASSSAVAAHTFLYEKLKLKYGYATFEECFADRVNKRAEWHDEIEAFNTPDKTKLGRIIFAEHDIYDGIRNRLEFDALKEARLFHYMIWVDASKRKEPESLASMQLCIADADFVIDNNGSEEDLPAQIDLVMEKVIDHYNYYYDPEGNEPVIWTPFNARTVSKNHIRKYI